MSLEQLHLSSESLSLANTAVFRLQSFCSGNALKAESTIPPAGKKDYFFFYHKELQRYPKTLYSFLLGSELLFMIDKSTVYIHFQGNEGWTTFKSSLELPSKLFIKTFTCLIVCFP